jgi:hypothetical protein
VEGRIREGATSMTMGSRVLTALGIVLCALGVTVAAAAAPVTAATTAQAHPQQSQPPVEGEGDIDPSDLPGGGTESNPYEISNVSELQAMEDDLDANYELVSDIDASDTAQFNDGQGFDPVGSFSGSFDGDNHTIAGLTIDRPDESNVGLFELTSSDATLTDVTLANATVTGDNRVGGLVGFNSGTITNAGVAAAVTAEGSAGGLVGFSAGQIETSSATGDVTSQTGAAGGLVGDTQQGVFIAKSFATGDVTVTNGRIAGGLVGAHLNGTITDSYARGDVDADNTVGGLVGSNVGETASINSSYATGTVNADGSLVGGLAGVNRGETSNSYWDEAASEQSTSAGDAVGLQTTEMQGEAAAENMSGFDFDNTWTTTSEYPALRALSGRQIPGAVDLTGVNLAVSSNGSIDLRGNLTNAGGTEISGAVVQVVSSEHVTPVFPRRSYFVGTLDSSEFAPVELTASADIQNATDVTVRIEYTVGTDRVVETTTISLPTDNETDESAGNGDGGGPIPVDVDPSDLSGDGSESNPYEISNVSELQAMEDDLDANYELVSDIDALQTGKNDIRFTPIGINETVSFIGTFDGADHIINGLSIDRPNTENTGLFGAIGADGEVRDVRLTNATVDARNDAGSLAGSNLGTIQNVSVEGTLTGRNSVGGLVGFNNGVIKRSSVNVDVTGLLFVGGLVGSNQANGKIADARATGRVDGGENVGGLVGGNSGSVRRTFAAGEIADGVVVGGLSSDNRGSISASYVDEGATGQSVPDFFDGVTGLTTELMQGNSAAETMTGFDFDNTWTTTSEYPALRALSETDKGSGGGGGGDDPIQVDVNPSDLPGDGSESTPYEISNVSELQAMEDDLDANYELVSDIDASQTAQFDDGAGFDPVGPSVNTRFTGSFDGSNHTVAGLTINRPSESAVGLFGFTQQATLTDITLTSVNLTGTRFVGGLVGFNRAKIQNATVSGSVTGTNGVGGLVGANNAGGTITNSRASGSVTGRVNVGGLVGQSRGNTTTARASGNVTGRDNVGGLVGDNDAGTVQNATTSGNVTGRDNVGGLVGENNGEIRDTFAVGSITGNTEVGGLVGQNQSDATVEQSYFDIQATGQTTSAGGIGLTTAEMQGTGAAQNMDLAFGETWQTVSGDYPELIAPQKTTNPSTTPFSAPVPGANGQGPPTDTDDDGKLEDINGDGEATFDDAIALAFADTSGLNSQQRAAVDFDGDGDVDFADAIALAFE